ncbi:hypothetical protein GC207_06575 [bacterium]|nr:hypothetical protein [bacterium]
MSLLWCRHTVLTLVLSIGLLAVHAEVRVRVDKIPLDDFDPGFRFPTIPSPAQNDAATTAKFEIVDGRPDPNSSRLETLHDGLAPDAPDSPAQNFFFAAGTDGGRLRIDLGKILPIKEINTYSIHPGSRGPQAYRLFASSGSGTNFNATPSRPLDPSTCGWQLMATVDTRREADEPGGQFGVSISDPNQSLGTFRYLLFDISQTESSDPFGNTFFSEIDVVDTTTSPHVIEAAKAPLPKRIRSEFKTVDGKNQITIDTTAAPDLTEWADKVLKPVVQTWYPKIITLLPSEGFFAPESVSIVFRPGINVPAFTSGHRITCSADWFRENLQGEAAGSVVHELVHVVQQYRRARGSARVPGWLVEGIPDYIRWYLYEPETRGAEIPSRNLSQARFDASYRVSANFLNWVVSNYDRDLVRKINAAARDGHYRESIWQNLTGRTVQELGTEWKRALEKMADTNSAARSDK